MPPKRGGKQVQSTPLLSGSKLNVDVRYSNTDSLRDFLASQPSLSYGEDCISLFKEILPLKYRGKALNLDTGYHLKSWESLDTKKDTIGWLTLESNGTLKRVKAYKKVMPLIDAMGWMHYKERPTKPFIWAYQPFDILEPENQAYIDCVASYMVGKIKERNHTPHFCTFYGCIRAVIDTYAYNLEDDFEDFRFSRWFWEGIEAKEFGLRVIEKHTGRQLSLDEIKALAKPDDEFLHDDSDSEDSSDSDTSSIHAETLPVSITAAATSINTPFEEINTDELSYSSTPRLNTTPKTVNTIQTASDASDTSDVSFSEEYEIYAELHGMPVAIQYIEACEGTLDEFLENRELVPVQTTEQSLQWSAWLFQICAALVQLQSSLQLTHNDLHTCNVLWKKTDETHLYYIDSNDRKWCVPSYGYIFTIIDYGRSIFTLNNYVLVSSDYNDGHDAHGMYNFGPIEDKSLPHVGPNKSFDLCRLACSMLRALYPTNPEPISLSAKILTKEGAWEVRETNQPIFNLLWLWLKTKQGHSVLETETGEEKYPGFDLYSIIARDVRDAIPEEQISKTIFKQFLYTGKQPQTSSKINNIILK